MDLGFGPKLQGPKVRLGEPWACLQALTSTACCEKAYLWLAGSEGMEAKMETTVMGYIGLGLRRNGKEGGNLL